MSYCRFGPESDVYVFPTVNGLECCQCRETGDSFFALGHLEMLLHLKRHIEHGDLVPDSAMERLRVEAKK